MDFKFDFDPAGFLNSLRKDSSTESNYLTMTFEEYLKKNNVWDMYKYRLNNTDDVRLNTWRKDYEEEMKKRRAEKEPEFLKNIDKLFNKKPEEDAEARRLAHISEFGH
jgi:hypothetical protein